MNTSQLITIVPPPNPPPSPYRDFQGADNENRYYLRVHGGEHDEGEKVLDAEDDDGEGVLHVCVWPNLHTHGVLGPGQGHCLQGLKYTK